MATVKAGTNGKAPAGQKIGTNVVTNGGTYKITGVNANGGYTSVKVPSASSPSSYSSPASSPFGSALSSVTSAANKAVNAVKTPSSSPSGGISPTSSPPSSSPSYLNNVTGNQNGTWQERLKYFYDNPSLVQNETARASAINTPASQDWINKLGGITPVAAAPKTLQDITSQLQTNMGTYNVPYEQLLRDLMAQPSAYIPPSEADMLAQSKQYANLQTDPLISALDARLSTAQNSAQNASNTVTSSYADVPANAQAQLNEARNYSQENAIARGMGRSGVVDWNTNKLSTPIIQSEMTALREKDNKLATIASELANTEAEIARTKQQTETQRGTLESTKLADLRQLAQQLAAQEQTTRFGQAQNLATLAQQGNLSQQQLLAQLAPLFLNG